MNLGDQSARELIWQLKTNFLTPEFQKVEKMLCDRENVMQKSLEVAKAESEAAELKCLRLEAESKKYKRMAEEMNEKVTTLNEDLNLSLERVKRAEEKCTKVLKELADCEAEKQKLIEKIMVSKAEKRKTEEELGIWKRKHDQLDARVARLEEDVMVLLNLDTCLKRNIEIPVDEVMGEKSLGNEKNAGNGDDRILIFPGTGSTTCNPLRNETGGIAESRRKQSVNEEEGNKLVISSLVGNEQRKSFIVIDSDDEKPLDMVKTCVQNLKRKRDSFIAEKKVYIDDNDDKLPIGGVKQEKLQEFVNLHKASPAVSPTSYEQGSIRSCRKKIAKRRQSLVVNDSSDGDDTSENENFRYSDLNEKIITNLLSQKESKEWAHEADMLCAFDNKKELCLNAVCALHRQSCVKGASCGRAVPFNGKGFNMFDAPRISRLGAILTNGDAQGKLKKSASDLEQSDLEDCQKLAKRYSSLLFNIYQKKKDPFFRPL